MSSLSPFSVTSLPVDFDPFSGGELSLTAPLTEAQKEIWASVQMGVAANCSYNESLILELKGTLDDHVLLQAIQALVDRHEILRATCSPDGSTLCIAQEYTVDLVSTDLSHFDHQEQTRQISHFSKQLVETPFDLEHGPLMRVQVVKLSDQDHTLLIAVHHIICDGWSIALLVSDLAELYTSIQQRRQPQLQPAVGFSEYAMALEEAKATSEAEEDLNYWLEQYADSIPTVEFPTDRPRPALRTFDSARVDYQLPPALITQLKQLGAKSGCSFMTTLLSGFEVYLSRMTGQSDIAVGVPAAGQAATGQYNLVGHCVNLLPLRTQVNTQLSFQSYLNQRKSTVLDAYDHQQFTFGTLVQALTMPRDPSRIPLVPIVFNIDQGLDTEQLPFADLQVSFESYPRSYENFELFINATELKGTVTLECQYNTNLFDRDTIQRRLAEFETFLNSIIGNPTQPMAVLSLISDSERQWLAQFNATQTDQAINQCLPQLVEAQVAKTPSAVAVVFEESHLTYQELNDRANRLANYLLKQGVGTNCLVGLCLERSLDMVVALLAILKTGGAYVPLDPANPPQRLALMLADSQVSMLVTQESLLAQIPDHSAQIICLDRDASQIAGESQGTIQSQVTLSQRAYVIYTSGSTGKPKGVEITHKSLANLLLSMKDKTGFSSADVFLAITTISFDIAALEIYLPLITGAQVVIASRNAAADGSKLTALLDRSRATFMQATPVTWQMLLTGGWQNSSDLKILCGGEALTPELVQELVVRGHTVWNVYGPTETTIWSLICELSADGSTIPIGQPLANTKAYILDANLQPLPRGIPGELCIGGDGLARGYLNRSTLTAEKFILYPDSQNGVEANPAQRLYRTGDWARVLPDGNIEWLGRIDYQVKIRGFRIELGEIEANLRQHSTVQEAVVIVREDTPGERVLVGYVIGCNPPNQETYAWIADIRQFIKSRLPDFMIPNHFVPLEAFPLTANGKVDRKSLPRPETSQQLAANFVAPRNGLETQIADIWSEVFKQEKIGTHDNFFDLGGYSLLAIQIVARLRQLLDVEILLPHLFESPTVADLAQRVEVLRWSIHDQAEPNSNQGQGAFEEGEL